jgi:hypothetical protein
MRKVIDGEKDEHDLFIEMAQKDMLEEASLIEKPDSKKDILVKDEVIKNTRLVGYTPEQLKNLSKTNLTDKPVKSILEIDPKKHYFLTKFIKPDIKPGKIVVSGDNISVESEKSSNNPPLVEGNMSLNELLDSRKIVLK